MSHGATNARLARLEEQSRALAQQISDLRRLPSDPPEATTRAQVMKILEDGIERSPLTLSQLTGKSRSLLAHLVRDMAARGNIVRVSWGKYSLPKEQNDG
jgi:AraC-like DNA-binding protein